MAACKTRMEVARPASRPSVIQLCVITIASLFLSPTNTHAGFQHWQENRCKPPHDYYVSGAQGVPCCLPVGRCPATSAHPDGEECPANGICPEDAGKPKRELHCLPTFCQDAPTQNNQNPPHTPCPDNGRCTSLNGIQTACPYLSGLVMKDGPTIQAPGDEPCPTTNHGLC